MIEAKTAAPEVTPKSGDPRDKTLTAKESMGIKTTKGKDSEPATKGEFVVSDTCVTFTDMAGNRVHAKHGDYVTPCKEDERVFLRKRAILPKALHEAQLAAAEAHKAAMEDLGD